MQIFKNLTLHRLSLTFPFTFVLSLVKGPQPDTFQKCVRWLALILTYRLLWKEILSLTTKGQAQGMNWHTVFYKGHLSLPFFSSLLLLFKLEPHATQSGLKFPMPLRIDPEILVLLPPLPHNKIPGVLRNTWLMWYWDEGQVLVHERQVLYWLSPNSALIFLSLSVSQTLNSTTPWGIALDSPIYIP